MAEVQAAAENTGNKEVASFGRPRVSTFNFNQEAVDQIVPQKEESGAAVSNNNADEGGSEKSPAPTSQEEGKKEDVAESKIEAKEKDSPKEELPKQTAKSESENEDVDISDDVLKKYFEKNGIEYEGMEALKSKLNPESQPTPEEIKKQQLAEDKRKVDIFVEGGGSVDQYVAIKEIATKPLAELSKDQLKYDLLSKGLTAEEVEEAMNDSFYQITDEELELYEEDEIETRKRKREAFASVLEKYATAQQQQAQRIIADLENEAKEIDRFAQEEEMTSAKIDEHFKALPRKLKVPMGDSNGKAVSSVEYEIPVSYVAEVQDMLKNPSKRNQIFKTSDGELNVEFLAELLLAHKYNQHLAKTSFLEGQHRAAQTVAETYGVNAYDIGIGGGVDRNKSNGQVVNFGKARRV